MRPLAGKLWTMFGERMADRFADKLMLRLEQDNALPLPVRLYDIVVDDPDMSSRHEYLAVEAISPLAAAVEGYRRAMRDEGFRCVASHPVGDEMTVDAMAREAHMWAVVHDAGRHPGIAYKGPRQVNEAQR